MNKNVKRGLAASISGAIINLALGIIKLFVGIVTNSISVFIDAVNNFTDIIGSTLAAVGIGVSNKKPTDEYPNGFGRMEYITTFVVSTMTLVMGGVFIVYSIQRIVYPLPIYFGWLYFWLLLVTLIVKVVMTIVYKALSKKDNSDIMRSLYLDSLLDSIITASTWICYALCLVTNTIIDAVLGIIIGVAVLIQAVKMVIGAVKKMLGKNEDVDLEELKSELKSEGIFTYVEWIRLSDYGKNNKQLFILGDLAEENKAKLKDIEQREKIKIYVVKE
mgnify:FL=1